MTSPLATPEPSDARERLLAAAEVEFAERGYDGATVREITRRAGANIAAINYYFGDKERLYVEAVKYAHSCATGGPLPTAPVGTTPVQRLAAFIREMLRRMHAPARPTSMKLMMREMTDPGKAANVVVDEFIRPMAFALREHLRAVLPGLDEKRLLMTGFSVIGQCLFYRQNRPVAELIFGRDAIAELDLDAVADHVVRFTLAALGEGPPIAETKTDGHKKARKDTIMNDL
ncbi:CerR family C-terminal domain-containing protein [Urbifossiella limnaea]|uniref:HTH-type transcriptional repressor AcnR n=1 Tax=Urbifossiella limnaea TaxID=2528023 RepID=A0A517XVE4_9BACT|nr:CerR family C-terminal domain-containing protein [Urbifossiella limnaea]QDU21482.1 HTH-type transcriptional repressor AcnR [Urbifossiella limnaea]